MQMGSTFLGFGGCAGREGLGGVRRRCSRGCCARGIRQGDPPGESPSVLQLVLIGNAIFLLSAWFSVPINVS